MSCFTQPDTIIPNPANPQDLNRYSYVRNNPATFNDPTGHEVCYISGDREGQCYEAADGEASAQTREEEAATVKVLLDEFDFNGNEVGQTNIRYTRFGGLSGQDIINSMRGGANPGALSGADLRRFRVEQLTLDRDNARIDVGNLTWVAVANSVNTVAPVVGATASGVCVFGGGPSNPVGATGCGVAIATDVLVVVANSAAAATCSSENCASDHIGLASVAGLSSAAGLPANEAARFASYVVDVGGLAGSLQTDLSDE